VPSPPPPPTPPLTCGGRWQVWDARGQTVATALDAFNTSAGAYSRTIAVLQDPTKVRAEGGGVGNVEGRGTARCEPFCPRLQPRGRCLHGFALS
jgi:hypothetical protein